MTAFRACRISSSSVAFWISRSLDVDTGGTRWRWCSQIQHRSDVRSTAGTLWRVYRPSTGSCHAHTAPHREKSHHHTLTAFWRTRERLLQDRFQQLVVALDFHLASVAVLFKFLKWEYDYKHFFLNLCVSLLGLSQRSACVCDWFASLQEAAPRPFLLVSHWISSSAFRS